MSLRTSTDDAVLVLRCQGGDARAFSALVDRWHPRLLRHAARLVGDAHAAGDITQDTWIAAIDGLQRLDDVDAFGSWLFRILTNKSTDWIRRRERRWHLWDRFRRRPQPEPPAEGHTSYESVHQAIAALPREHAEVVALHYLEEFNVQQVAEILGVPAGTVKSRLHYARVRLRVLLREPDHVRDK
jgi:RNA polymerase sigma-70 factor (ECF subfamily)